MKATIKNIGITIGDKRYDWTLEEAEAVREALNSILGKRESWPVYIPPASNKSHPLPMTPPYKRPEIWCGVGTFK